MICQECGKELTNEKDSYGHDCEAKTINKKKKLKATEETINISPRLLNMLLRKALK